MDIVGQLQKQYVDFLTSLYQEGFLDNQFAVLQELQDDGNPDFVVEIISIYFEDSEKLLNNVATALQQQVVDFEQVGSHAHQLKGSSSNVGAQRVTNICAALRSVCDEKNLDGCRRYSQQLQHEFHLVKNKLESLIRMERQILEAGGTIPVIG